MASNLTPSERQAFAEYFRVADTADLGVLTGDIAVSFFEKSGLPPVVLGEIWGIADESNDGFLPPARFNVAARLIGHAQRGETVTEALVSKPGNVPFFAGVSVPGLAASSLNPPKGAAAAPVAAAPAPAAVISPQPTGAGLAHLKPTDRARFLGMFTNAGPEPSTGLLAGEKARDIFLKSKLPFDTLGQIWNLADTQGRGALDGTDFSIGMHLIQQTMAGNIRPPLPPTLPPGLYQEASGRASAPALTPSRQASAVPRQVTGAAPSPLRQQTTGAFGRPATAQAPWAITAGEKAGFDAHFETLDTQRQGTIDGGQAVPFFMDSGLPETTLAQVWDLADIRKNGQLDKDEFAVAMKLIHDKIGGKEVPATLPNELVPPALRNLAAAAVPSSPTSAYGGQGASETQRDLFSLLDDDDEPEPATAVQPVKTGASAAPSPFAMPPTTRSFSPALSQAATTTRSPAASIVGSSRAAPTQIAQRTGDEDAVAVGNMHAQLASTQSSLTSLQTQRSALDSSVATSASQLSSLQTQLAAARAAHSTETTNLENLRTRAKTHADDLKTTRESLIRAESDLSALKVERAELEGQLMRDKEDARMLKEKLKQVTLETEKLKTETETARKEVRQNKGLAAISRKQYERAEEVRDRSRSELEDVKKESAASTATSPAPSVRSMNPFERMRSGTEGQQQSGSSHSAVATGAAIGVTAAAGAGIVEAISHHEHAAPETVRRAEQASPVAANQQFPEISEIDNATSKEPADDFEAAFGPSSTMVEPSTSIAAAAPVQDSFKSNFDDAFGDQPTTAAPISTPDDAPIAAPTSHAVAASTRAAADSSDEEDEGPEEADGHHHQKQQHGSTATATTEASPFAEPEERQATPIVPGAMPDSPASIGNDHFTDAPQTIPTSPERSMVATTAGPPTNGTGFGDEFEKEFEDLKPATTTATAPVVTSIAPNHAPEADFDDAFDREFNDSFASAPSAPNGSAVASTAASVPTISHVAGVNANANANDSSAFDDAFKDFDQPSAGPTTSTPAAAAFGSSTNGFGFDNSFGSLGGVGKTIERKLSGPEAGDMPAVGQVCALGFSRTQAITALERSGFECVSNF